LIAFQSNQSNPVSKVITDVTRLNTCVYLLSWVLTEL